MKWLLLLGLCSCAGASFEASAISADAATSLEAVKPPLLWDATVTAETGAPSNEGGGDRDLPPAREASPPSFEDAPNDGGTPEAALKSCTSAEFQKQCLDYMQNRLSEAAGCWGQCSICYPQGTAINLCLK